MRPIPQIQIQISLISSYFSVRIFVLELNRAREKEKMPLVHHIQFPATAIPSAYSFLRAELVPRNPHGGRRGKINRDNSLSTHSLSAGQKLPFSPETIDFELFPARGHNLTTEHLSVDGWIHPTATCTCDFPPPRSPVGATLLRVPPLMQATTRRGDPWFDPCSYWRHVGASH